MCFPYAGTALQTKIVQLLCATSKKFNTLLTNNKNPEENCLGNSKKGNKVLVSQAILELLIKFCTI